MKPQTRIVLNSNVLAVVHPARTAFCVLLLATTASAQFADWTTTGFDAQRSHWLRSDTKISRESMAKPGFELVWKAAVAQNKTPLTPPALLDFYIGYRGFRSLAFIGGHSNLVAAFDTDLGRLEWRKDFKIEGAASQSSAACPGGMTSAVARPRSVGYPPPATARGAGRANPAKSGVGEPFEGAVTLRPAPAPKPAPAPPPTPGAIAPAASTRRAATAPSPFAPRVQFVHALTSDGKLHSLYVSNGEEPKEAVQFIPPNSYARGLMVVDDIAYVATANGCGGTADGVWALDLKSGNKTQWKAGSSVAGSIGVAVGPDGTVYAAAGGELAALEERSLAPKSSYKIGGQEFTSSPVIFDFKGRDLIAAASNDGRLHLVDAASPTKAVDVKPSLVAGLSSGALASWSDTSGTRWILAAASGVPAAGASFASTNGPVKNGAIAAWKIVEDGGTATLQPGWISRDMTSPLTPIVVNGVVFAVAGGEYSPGDAKVNAAERARRSSPAVLYAFDSATGKELWNSGKTMTAYASTGGLAAGGSRVYVSTHDGTQYVFGFPIEH